MYQEQQQQCGDVHSINWSKRVCDYDDYIEVLALTKENTCELYEIDIDVSAPTSHVGETTILLKTTKLSVMTEWYYCKMM
jgi:hypothetical protein